MHFHSSRQPTRGASSTTMTCERPQNTCSQPLSPASRASCLPRFVTTWRRDPFWSSTCRLRSMRRVSTSAILAMWCRPLAVKPLRTGAATTVLSRRCWWPRPWRAWPSGSSAGICVRVQRASSGQPWSTSIIWQQGTSTCSLTATSARRSCYGRMRLCPCCSTALASGRSCCSTSPACTRLGVCWMACGPPSSSSCACATCSASGSAPRPSPGSRPIAAQNRRKKGLHSTGPISAR
mmetsp:Transcript_36682/g.91943  ORF Transcript_36682/g.91943 Transcript_36682/m.91943 type:complete len:236 (+) Transcript_36682:3171-3878(+)